MKLQLFLLGLCMALPMGVRAQSDNTKPIQLIIPASAGTTGDQMARILAPKLSQRLNAPVYVENKVGAGGSIAFDYVARSKPDGHTFVMTTTAFSTLPAVRTNLPYKPSNDFAHVVLLGTSPLVLVVNKNSPATTAKDFVDLVKKRAPGSLNYASPGTGSVQHLTMEMFLQEAGIRITHVPYKTTGSVVNDVAAGHVEASFLVLQTAAALVKSGQLKMLAVVAPKRSAQFPEVPTLAESGFSNTNRETWVGMAAAASTPATIVTKLNAEMNLLLEDADVKRSLNEIGVTPGGGSPQVMQTLASRDIEQWKLVARKAGLTAK